MALMNGPTLPRPSQPYEVAAALADTHWRDAEGKLLLVRWRALWMQWQGQHWAEVPTETVITHLYRLTDGAIYEGAGGRPRRWPARNETIKAVLTALKTIVAIPNGTELNTWLDDPDDPTAVVSFTNGLLFLDDGTLCKHDPAFFNLDFKRYAYSPEDPAMVANLTPDDPIAAFVSECCIRDRDAVLPKREVRAAFDQWAAQFKERAPRLSPQHFSRRLVRTVGPDLRIANHRIAAVQTHVFIGLRLKPRAVAA